MAEHLERTRRGRSSRPAFYGDAAPERQPKSDNLLGWTVFIILLVGLAFVCWFGSIYIFGHPEEPFSYSVLKKLKKVEEPKRFLNTAGPRGKFFDAADLAERYNQMTASQLRSENATLLRNFILNYKQIKDLVPYASGDFKILDSYELTDRNFIQSGVVALMQSTENPQILVEHIFPADKKQIPMLHRSLLTGFDFTLRRAQDLSAILNVDRLPDGRLKLTVVPLTYGSYAATQGPGAFALEPPKTLNVEAGLPILSKEKVEEAEQRYANYLRKIGADTSASAAKGAGSQLIPVQPAKAVSEAPKVARALPVTAPDPVRTPAPTPTATPAPIATPVAVATPESAPPTPEPTVMAAIPVAPGVAASVQPDAAGTDSPQPAVPLKPFLQGSAGQGSIQAGGAGTWQTYKPGQMPRGRLYGLNDAASKVGQDNSSERMYLQGDFEVTAAGPKSAVLRPPGTPNGNVRVIVEFPRGKQPPEKGARVTRGNQRPFLIDRIDRSADGHINIYAREVTGE